MTARWRHKKRGTEYVEIGRGKFQHSKDSADTNEVLDYIKDYLDAAEVVIYQSVDDGQIYARLAFEFEDGRFERVTEADDAGRL